MQAPTSIPSTSIHPLKPILEADMCVGCGTCAGICPTDALTMEWGANGLRQPHIEPPNAQTCQSCNTCSTTCPFADGLIAGIESPDEDELARRFLVVPESKYDETIGSYLTLKAGHACELRHIGSSGAVATWTLSTLLDKGLIDAALCVAESGDKASSDAHFGYRVCTTKAEIIEAAKTRYYPVSLDQVIHHVLKHDGRFALVGLPCFIKSIRLAQQTNPLLRERIVFMVGIFCGGLKTRYYTEFLAAHAGVDHTDFTHPEYRVKSPDSMADDYFFKCRDKTDREHAIRMRTLGDMWGTGLFKPNVCDYCDDLSAELADISIGDAWIAPYRADGAGTSIVVTRSEQAKSLLDAGEAAGELDLDSIDADAVNFSQRGNINHRRKGLGYRLYLAIRHRRPTPRKRVQPNRPINPLFALIQRQRIHLRKRSHAAWQVQRNTPGTKTFHRLIDRELKRLERTTRLSHKLGEFIRNVKGVVSRR